MKFLALLLAACALPLPAADSTALDRYVAAPDASYRYRVVRTVPVTGGTISQIELVSQTWLSTAEVNAPEWHHWLTIIQPENPRSATAVLSISGGSFRSTPDTPDPLLTLAAVQTGLVMVDIAQVPSEPLQFADEKTTRSEDAIIAYSWDKFLRTGDERWPARLPMTQSAVRAMDAATEFLAKSAARPWQIRNFIVTGASKRGWTTWSTAATDPRVIAIAPIVFDSLNLEAAFQHHWRAYGFWAPAVHDYAEAGVMNWFGTPQIAALLDIEDPYAYRDRLALPKYMINATGDQFFLPDSSRFAFSDLPGEKYLRYVPNADHGMSGLAVLEAASNLFAWVQAVTQNFPRPRFSWRADREQGDLVLHTLTPPTSVKLWQATNPRARDFRLETIGAAWTSQALEGDRGIYRIHMPAPESGWTAWMVELTFPGPADLPLVFTTEVMVTPDVYPFEPYVPTAPVATASRRRR